MLWCCCFGWVGVQHTVFGDPGETLWNPDEDIDLMDIYS